jgi:hypothetical protein
MAKKHMKKCSPFLAINKIQIKTTLSFHLIPVIIATIKNITTNKCWGGCRCRKKIELPYDPGKALLGIYLKGRESGYNKGTCTPIFIAALFTIAKLWKQPRCPTTDQ